MEMINGKYKIRIPCPDDIKGCGVCHYAWLDEDAYNQVHDCYYDTYKFKPNETTVAQTYNMLPKEIPNKAKEWGWHDTEVRDEIYAWMKERSVIIDPLEWERIKRERRK
ncbi:hypothetical protein [Priestia aryabhattai]|uniref:hypothetical protein n=1 Tax=Priestia aryabhattai TaxID=412384 RepID=UPI0015F3571B|nr:hypothetical protein [Priestia aryabhattai]